MDLISMQPLWHEMEVKKQADVALARAVASKMAEGLGFSPEKRADIVLSVSEMAQNHVKHHTVSGRLRFFGQCLLERSVMSISSLDMGPGITNIKKALEDGITSSNGLGTGLGCIRRIADRFAICSGKLGDFPCPDLLSFELESVTLVTAEFYSVSSRVQESPLDFSYLIRPVSGERYCGDCVFSLSEDDTQAIVVMDALGHGKEAAEAASVAVEFLKAMPATAEPIEMLMEAGRGLVHSRGVSAQAVRVDTASCVVDTAAIGNVNQYLYLDGRPVKVSGHPGILGPVISRSSISTERFLNFQSVLGIMHTDGLGSVPQVKFQQTERSMSALLWTHYLFSCCNQGLVTGDDATLVVWKCRD